MNYPIAVAFGLITLTVLAHMSGGILDSLTVRPSRNTDEKETKVSFDKIERNWVQLMCAFQIVSVDLIAIAGVLYLLAFTDALQPSSEIAVGLSVLFAFWGIAWLVQLASLQRPKKDYLFLSHWGLWFLCSGLLFWGAQTL